MVSDALLRGDSELTCVLCGSFIDCERTLGTMWVVWRFSFPRRTPKLQMLGLIP